MSPASNGGIELQKLRRLLAIISDPETPEQRDAAWRVVEQRFDDVEKAMAWEYEHGGCQCRTCLAAWAWSDQHDL